MPVVELWNCGDELAGEAFLSRIILLGKDGDEEEDDDDDNVDGILNGTNGKMT